MTQTPATSCSYSTYDQTLVVTSEVHCTRGVRCGGRTRSSDCALSRPGQQSGDGDLRRAPCTSDGSAIPAKAVAPRLGLAETLPLALTERRDGRIVRRSVRASLAQRVNAITGGNTDGNVADGSADWSEPSCRSSGLQPNRCHQHAERPSSRCRSRGSATIGPARRANTSTSRSW